MTELCVNLCEIAPPGATADVPESLLAESCAEAGFPSCERIYLGSYFCDRYFCSLGDGLFESASELCRRHDMNVTLAVPVFGQALLEEGDRLVARAIEEMGSSCDEIVANDVAAFLELAARYRKRMGLGRLFCKEPRDARITEMLERTASIELSAESEECVAAAAASGREPVIEIDPVSSVVDVSRIVRTAPGATVAVHLPFCYATTGRTCAAASTNRPVEGKFRPGCECALECLATRQRWRTDENAEYVKHGRTLFFENSGCAIVGTFDWRIVYT